MIKSAEFSECGKYRYLLTRIWDEKLPVAMCIGLNPSKANSLEDDPTILHLTRRLTFLGYGGLKMVNLYAYISSTPKTLQSVPDALGDNDKWIETTAFGVQEIIFCWGGFKQASAYRTKKMIEMFPDGKCFGKTAEGRPIHPLAMFWGGIKVEQTTITKFK